MKKNMVEVSLLQLLHHLQVHLPQLLLLLPLGQVGGSNLWQVIHYLKDFVLLVILKCVSYHLLNHMHDVGCKSTALEGPVTHTPDLSPNKIKDTEGLCTW